MKKILILILILFLSACSLGNEDDKKIDNNEGKYKITIYDESNNGIITSDKEFANEGETVTLTITPNTGYEFDCFFVMGREYKGNSFIMPDCDIYVFVYFKECLYNVTINDNISNGKIDVSKDTAKQGEEITIDVMPDEGYKLESIYLNDELLDDTTFVMPNKNVYLTATFTKKVADNGCVHNYIAKTLKEATCEEDGILEYRCSKCSDAYTATISKTGHDYKNDICNNCGKELEKTYLHTLFGNDIDIYTNDEENPYNIDLNEYGSDVSVYFYEPKLSSIADPYTSVNKTTFYASYERATSYEDAYYRTKHYLMSGDITDQYYLPKEEKVVINNQAVRATTATYVLNTEGDYLAYVPNTPKGEEYIIFYGAAYSSLNDVAAYLLAFGEAPANQLKSKDSNSTAMSQWGKFLRLNISRFKGDITKYPYEPELPNILAPTSVYYSEIDFGTTGGFTLENRNKTYYQVPYNNGSSITRGTVRIVFVSDWNIKSIDERYVFYTYNHYNDFQEYLNYHDGWGYRFGNESAGNEYCYGTQDYYNFGCVPPTQYPITLLKKYSEIQK